MIGYMKSNKPIKTRQAITWGRYSSDQQKDGDSKSRQDRLNRATAKQFNISIMVFICSRPNVA
jgi:hypothetical protein